MTKVTIEFTADELDALNTSLNKATIAWYEQIDAEPNHEYAQVRSTMLNEASDLWSKIYQAQLAAGLRKGFDQ